MKENLKAKKIKITGRVQGVGFRPFIYRLAAKFNLSGYVENDGEGVVVFVEGDEKKIISFTKAICQETPPLSEIANISIDESEPLYRGQFEIVHDDKIATSKTATISPDFAICDECKIDILNKPHKYGNYFATNCTNCGPRYSIIQTVPYDRVNTSMAKFTMCASCQEEYNNPLDRRYHAQPISCPACGPQLDDSIESMADAIAQGAIVAIKGIGGFHIICDATNKKSVEKLRVFKSRPRKPFAIMCRDLEEIRSFAHLSSVEEDVLKSKEAPVVLLTKKECADRFICSAVAPGIDRVGCFLAYTPLHCLLFNYLKRPIVATSANLGGEPIITTKEEIEEKLPFINKILDFNRDIVNAIDDSVVQIISNQLQILRLARGYAPKTMKLPFSIKERVLAVGANQKNTIALAFEDKIIISPYIGDLNAIKTFEFFIKTLQTFQKFYDFEADVILHDKHPHYETTKWALQQGKKTYAIQHHLAHIYAAKAEFGLVDGEYLGFSFDGTGYGDDGTLWGGEVFVGERRVYHFKPLKLLGGEKAIKEPRRVALSMLFEKYTLEEILQMDLSFSQNEIKFLYQSYQKNLNAPLSSSVGRLFDGVASLANLLHFQSYEGEAGLLCEMAYNKEMQEVFNFTVIDGVITIEFDLFDKEIVSKFINTLAEIVLFIAKKESKDVILSGGVFQNRSLLELITEKLEKEGINYYYQKQTPINDSGISLGQLWSYLHGSN